MRVNSIGVVLVPPTDEGSGEGNCARTWGALLNCGNKGLCGGIRSGPVCCKCAYSALRLNGDVGAVQRCVGII
jgi:hypothetical protein